MNTEADVAALIARMDASDRRHDEATDDRGRLWAQIDASRTAREATNAQLVTLNGRVGAIEASLGETKDLIRGDIRRVIYGGATALVVVAALLVLALVYGPAAVGDVVKAGLRSGTP